LGLLICVRHPIHRLTFCTCFKEEWFLPALSCLQPDICCLQEVDDKVFSEFLQPHLALAGFSGHFTNKQGRVREGSALFWRGSKWACAAVQDVKLRVRFWGFAKPALTVVVL
jgi:mRNA deadenylase 3'-5' endonuclease subunit Ccr4